MQILEPLFSSQIAADVLCQESFQVILCTYSLGVGQRPRKILSNIIGVHSLWSPSSQWQPTPVLLPGKSHGQKSLVGCRPLGREMSDTTEQLHFHFPALEKEMATHSSVLAWRIPGMGEPGGLPSTGSHRVEHNWSDLAAAALFQLYTLMYKKHLKIFFA